MSWQPIETFSYEDGSQVLIYCSTEQRIVSSRWEANKSERGGAWYGTDPMDRLNWIQYPTHWMLLPDPPVRNTDLCNFA